MTCFFIGHRDAPEDIYAKLREAVADHIAKHGVTDFVVGHYGRFDSMAARAVREEKVRYPEVTLTLLLPYYPYTYDTDKYDGSFYPPGMEAVPKPFAIVRANQYMLRHSDYLICYCRDYPGNTQALVEAALRLERDGRIRVTNIEKNNVAT